MNIELLHIGVDSLEATNIECSLPNISTRMPALENMVQDRVQPSQLTKKKQNGVKLAKPPTQISKETRKNAIFRKSSSTGLTVSVLFYWKGNF